jgi:hypothetical protein
MVQEIMASIEHLQVLPLAGLGILDMAEQVALVLVEEEMGYKVHLELNFLLLMDQAVGVEATLTTHLAGRVEDMALVAADLHEARRLQHLVLVAVVSSSSPIGPQSQKNKLS